MIDPSPMMTDTVAQTKAAQPAAPPLQGAILVLIQFDVCEEIKLDQLRQIFGARTVQHPSMKHPAPGYVRYQRPPVVEPIETLVLESGERLEGQIKYYDYGVLSVVFELPFSGDWDTLIRLGSRWVWDVDFAGHASRIARQKLEAAAPALVKPYPSGSAKTISSSICGRSWEIPARRIWPLRMERRLPRSCAAKLPSSPKANGMRFCSLVFPTTPTIFLSSAGTRRSCMTLWPGPTPRSSFWSTPTRSCWNSATTTN